MTDVRTLAAFIRRDWLIARHYRLSSLLTVSDVLVTVAMFYYLSRLIAPSGFLGAAEVAADGYFAFVVVGMALLRILTVALAGFSTKLREDQLSGSLEALFTSAGPRWVIIVGSGAFDMLRATVTALLLLVIAAIFFGFRIHPTAESAASLLLAVPTTLALFVAVGIAFAGFTLVFRRTLAALSLLTGALSVLGGVYFPVSLLPSPIEELARLLPFTWAVETVRSGLLGGDVELAKLTLLVVAAAVAVPISLNLFRQALDHARRTGTLTHY